MSDRLTVGVAARLSRYLQVLTQAKKMGKERISSQEISDYTNIHPSYGTLQDFESFLTQAHARGLELHAWFNPFRGNATTLLRAYIPIGWQGR